MTRTAAQYLILALLSMSAALECLAGSDARPSWDSYKTVVTKNIFLRDRGSRRAERGREAPPPPPPPERFIVLRGTIQQGEDSRAFLEDVRTGKTEVRRPGETLAAGRLGAITLSYIEYECNGAVKRVEIGANLEGAASLPVAFHEIPEVLNGTAMPAAPTASGEPPSAEEAAILERLRQRRQNEGGN